MMTVPDRCRGCILALDLDTATFSAFERPGGAAHSSSSSLKFSREHNNLDLYLIYATGRISAPRSVSGRAKAGSRGQWVLMDTISVCV
jgi:hypothetical protein